MPQYLQDTTEQKERVSELERRTIHLHWNTDKRVHKANDKKEDTIMKNKILPCHIIIEIVKALSISFINCY